MKRLSIFFAALMACTLSFAQTTFEKVTAAPADWSGEYLLVYENSATEAYVFNGLDAANGYTTATIANGKITADGLVTLTIAAMDGGYSILLKGGDNDGKYLGYTAAKNGMNFSTSAIKNTLAIESNAVAIKSGTTPSTMRFNAASDQMRFRYYKQGQKPVQLYKKATGGVTPVTPVAVESVALDKAELSIEAGKTATLVASITPANATNKSVTWATDNDKVATVADGVVTAVAEGKANITVTTADGAKTATCAVTVTAVKPIDGMNYSVDLGTAEGYNTWTVDNKELSSGLTYVWKCDADKKYAKGSAYAGSNKAAEAWLISPKLDLSKAEVATMTINHALNHLKGNPNPLSVQGTKDGVTWDTLEVNGWPAGTDFTFNDATVDLTSVISASTQIAFVYKSTTEVAPTWEIKTVAIKGSEVVHATEIKLDKETLELEQYRNSQLTATLTPAEVSDIVEWTSSDETVATVDNNGVVTAVGVGTATITVTAGSVSATCDVTVITATALTCAEVVELAKDLNSGDILAGGKRVVRGYVTEYYNDPAADLEKYKNYSVYMADTKDGGKIFEAFQVKPVDGKTVVAIGDYVEVIGEITKHNTTIETVGKGAATIQKIKETGTALDNSTGDKVVVEKVVRNGQVLIIRDGKTYNVIGKMVD